MLNPLPPNNHASFKALGLKRTNYVRNIFPISTSLSLPSKKTVYDKVIFFQKDLTLYFYNWIEIKFENMLTSYFALDYILKKEKSELYSPRL